MHVRSSSFRYSSAWLSLFACTSPVWAQSATTGALTGVVTDPSGGVISGATVTLTNTGTGQSRTATTDASGNYKFSLIPPGTYSLKFEAAGFKTSTVSSVTVSITETPVLSQKLEIGAQTSEVTVEATAETIQTQNATVGNLVGSQTVTTLPLSSRNYTHIIDLSPGVVVERRQRSCGGQWHARHQRQRQWLRPKQLHDGWRHPHQLRQRRRSAVRQLPRHRAFRIRIRFRSSRSKPRSTMRVRPEPRRQRQRRHQGRHATISTGPHGSSSGTATLDANDFFNTDKRNDRSAQTATSPKH